VDAFFASRERSNACASPKPKPKDKAFVDQAAGKFKENITKAVGNLRLMLEEQQTAAVSVIDEPPLIASSQRFPDRDGEIKRKLTDGAYAPSWPCKQMVRGKYACHVSYGSFADMASPRRHVCFTPESGRRSRRPARQLWANRRHRTASPRLVTRTSSLYRRTPTRLTPPFQLPGPAVAPRTAARATGRGLSTTPALATQPTG